MFKIAQTKKLKKGFTLLELLIVMAILIATSSMIGAGIIYLQNSVRLDNAVRTLKSEIQSTQNNARNSFVAYQEGTDPTSQTNVNFFTQRKLNVGWIMELENTNNRLKITKRSVYLDTAAVNDQSTLDLNNLRQQIKAFKNSNTGLYCQNDVLFNSTSAATINIGSSVALKCSTSLVGETIVAEEIVGATVESGGNSLCSYKNNKYNLFFTSAYGEPAIGVSDCQIRIKNSGNFGINTRSILIDYKTATATVCGKDCFTKGGAVDGEYTLPTTQPLPNITIAPLPTRGGGDTTDPVLE